MLRKIIDIAFDEALKSKENGEIPIGAVIFNLENLEIIAVSGNEVEKQKNPLAHAEILVINKALSKLNTSRLDEYGIYVTLEPCTMCMGAISHVHLKKVFFGAYQDKKLIKEHKPDEIMGGFSETKATEMLKSFFKNLRKK